MYLAVEVGKFVKQVVTEWCPSTTGPLLPTMTEWAGYLVPTGVLPPFDNCGAHRTACPTNTPVWTALIWDQIVRWTGGGGGFAPPYYRLEAPRAPGGSIPTCLEAMGW